MQKGLIGTWLSLASFVTSLNIGKYRILWDISIRVLNISSISNAKLLVFPLWPLDTLSGAAQHWGVRLHFRTWTLAFFKRHLSPWHLKPYSVFYDSRSVVFKDLGLGLPSIHDALCDVIHWSNEYRLVATICAHCVFFIFVGIPGISFHSATPYRRKSECW